MTSIIISIVLFVTGFFILIKGADFVIRGSVSIARFLHLSEWLIAVVIVGIGTSIPELSINITAALEGNSIGIGTILGSNIFNIFCILGILSLATPVVLKKSWTNYDLPLNIIIIAFTGAVLFLPLTGVFDGIARGEAVLLFLLFLAWIVFMVKRKDDADAVQHQESSDTTAWYIALILIAVGLVGVFFGSEWIVHGAENLARLAGVSEVLIGLSIISIGTSIPEVTISLRAIIKKNTNIAVGNIIGSNIFDLLGILGIAGLIAPIAISTHLFFDFIFLFAGSIILYIYVRRGTQTLSRKEGLTLVLFYLIYLILIGIRG